MAPTLESIGSKSTFQKSIPLQKEYSFEKTYEFLELVGIGQINLKKTLPG